MGVTGARLRAVLGAGHARPVGVWPEASPGPSALTAGFTRWFGTPPSGLWHAPGRLALMGEHTAASEGPALYVCLPWGVTAAVGTAEDPGVRVATVNGPLSERHRAVREVASVVASARDAGLLKADHGVRVVLGSDLPEHSSLGHSVAVGAAVALALSDLAGTTPPDGLPLDLRVGLEARSGHLVRVNRRGGRTALFPFDLEGSDLRLVLVDTGALPRRDLRPVRAAELARAQETLGPLRSVQDLPAALRRIQNPALRDRVEFAVTETHRLNAAVGLLREGRFGEVGPILSASHLSLRRFDLPLPAVETAVEAAARSGARGARMSGWAGTSYALVPSERVENVVSGIREAFRVRGRPEPRVRVALPSEGARRVD